MSTANFWMNLGPPRSTSPTTAYTSSDGVLCQNGDFTTKQDHGVSYARLNNTI